LHLSCAKEHIDNIEDQFIEEPEQLSELNAEITAAALTFLEIQWKPVRSSHFAEVTYSLYLNDQMIIQGLTTNKYSLINLEPGREYTIKVQASTKDDVKSNKIITARTLPSNQADQIIYHNIHIHSYSTFMGPASIEQLQDGGHLMVRYIQHPGYIQSERFKIVVMRVDQKGEMIWYRLLETPQDSFDPIISSRLILHNDEKEGIVFIKEYAFKISILSSEIIQEIDFKGLNELGIESVHATERQLLVGTLMGSLLSIDPNNLSIKWRYSNIDQRGAITAINTDSKGNIYASFSDYNDPINSYIHKYNSKGEYITRFPFDREHYSASLLVDKEDNFYLFPLTGDENIITYYKFDAGGQAITKKSIPNSVSAPHAFWDKDGNIVVFGSHYTRGTMIYGGVYTFDKDLNILSSRFYNDLSRNLILGLTQNDNRSFNFFIYIDSDANSDFYFIRADTKGNI